MNLVATPVTAAAAGAFSAITWPGLRRTRPADPRVLDTDLLERVGAWLESRRVRSGGRPEQSTGRMQHRCALQRPRVSHF